MPEKIKITQDEFDEMYTWDDVKEDKHDNTDKPEVTETKNASYEEYTEYYDKKQYEEEK